MSQTTNDTALGGAFGGDDEGLVQTNPEVEASQNPTTTKLVTDENALGGSFGSEESPLAQSLSGEAQQSADSAQASEEAAQQFALDAEQSANEANASKESALTSETNAATSASNASTSAAQAATSATNAASSEANAATSESNAASSASSAATSESNAEDSATAAALSETNAEDSSNSALLSANSASTSASQANTSATNAATSASNAATSESNASTSASQAATSASSASTSAANAATSEANAASSASSASTSATNADTSATNAATSEANAATSEANAATSESNAATSATNAATSATDSSNSADLSEDWATKLSDTVDGVEYSSKYYANQAQTTYIAVDGRATDAEAFASNAATSEVNAATSEANALTSATNAATSEANALGSANDANTSAIAASTSAGNADTSAANAATSASNAATSELNAQGSASDADVSATQAATSETNAATSETNAATSESNAATSESNAAASESAAATSEANASVSASNAATSATSSSNSASEAANSAAAAATSATNAANSAASAASSATSASASATDAFNSLDEFQDIYLGAKATDPTLDNDGDALQVGALYFNTTDNDLKVWTGSVWTIVLVDAELQSLIDTAITNLIDGAPGALDTLNELAAALGDDPNFASTVASSINNLQQQIDTLDGVKYESGDSANLADLTLTGMNGPIQYDSNEGTLAFPISDSTTIHLGHEMTYKVKNTSGTTITKGMVLAITGQDNGDITVAPYIADGTFLAGQVVGIANEDILNNNFGYAITQGHVEGFNTLSFTAGSFLYASPDTPGGMVTTPPTSPDIKVILGICTVSDVANGEVVIRINFSQNAAETNYDNSISELTSTNVQGALDELQQNKASVDLLSSNINLFPTTTTSPDVANHNKLVTSKSDSDYDDPAVDVATGVIGSTETMVGQLVSDAGLIEGSIAGITVTLIGNIDKTGGGFFSSAHFYFKMFRREADGTEHEMGESNHTDAIASTDGYEQFSASVYLSDTGMSTFALTDRIVIRFYGEAQSGSPEYNFQFGGSQPIRALVPVPISVVPSRSATETPTDTTNFNGFLSTSDTNVQAALDSLDNHNHDLAYAPLSGYNKSDWDTAFSWGDHDGLYLPIDAVTLPDQTGHAGQFLTTNGVNADWATVDTSQGDTAYGWGNHALAGYLTSYNETDPVFSASAASGITTTNISNWNTAYNWGNHASAGYLTSHQDISGKADLSGATFTGPVSFAESGSTFRIDPHTVGVDLHSTGNIAPHYQTNFTLYTGNIGSGTQRLSLDSSGNLSVTGTLSASGYNKSNWDTAYGWGNHASAGYLTTSTGVQQLVETTSPNYTTPSSRRVNPNSTNPTNEHYAVMTYGNGGNVTGQIATHFQNGATYNRAHNNSWSAWSRMFDDEYHPNADKWTTARTITLGGDLTGSVNIDGSSNVTLSGQVVNDSHTHDGRYYTESEADSRFAPASHSHNYVSEGGTSFSGEYPLVARIGSNNFYSDGNIRFQGSDSKLTVDGRVDAPIFYDSGNTSFYWNPNGGGAHRLGTPSGYIDIGPQNSGHCHFNTDRSNFYFSKNIRVNSGLIDSYDEDLQLRRASNASSSIRIYSSYSTATGSMRSPLFYDSDNTGYYGNFASTSRLNILNANSILMNGTEVLDSSRNLHNINTARDVKGGYYKSTYHSGSDFANGTLVQTDIPATASSGASYVIEVTGKSYSTAPPFSFIAQGYLYNNTIINHSGVNNGDLRLTYIKALEYNGNLCFWWPRISYWNSFEVHVRNAGGDGTNRVTSIGNAAEPSSSKKVQTNLRKSVMYDFNTNSGALYGSTFYDSNDTGYYVDPASTSILNSLTVYGTTTLGNGSGDTTRINDILELYATDSGDSHFYFGENSSGGYGSYWYWDSGYRHTWYSRHAGTNSGIMYHDTNDTTYLHMSRHMHLHNKDINYVNQLHFNANVRFYDEGNDSYLNFKWGDTGAGGIKFLDGNTSVQGYVYGDGGGKFGLLDKDGHWFIRSDGASYTELRSNNNVELTVSNSYVTAHGSMRAPIFYDSNNTGYYCNPASTTKLNALTTNSLTVGGSSVATASSVPAAVANSSAGAVGSYVLAMEMGSNRTARSIGSTVSGSSLMPSSININNGSVGTARIERSVVGFPGTDDHPRLSGTWRLMAGYADVSSYNDYPLALWLRIS